MSNQDPFNNDKSKNDYWGTTRDWSTTEETGTEASTQDFGQSGFDDSSATAEGMTDKAKHVAEEGKHKAEEMTEKAKHVADDSKQKASEMAGMAKERADQGIDKAAESMDKAAEMVRQKGEEQGGTVGSVAGSAAGAMESASAFLKDTDTSQLMDQLEAYIRKNPTQSLLVAAGIGFVLSKAFK